MAHGGDVNGARALYIYLCKDQRIHGMVLLFGRIVEGGSMHWRLVVDRAPRGGIMLDGEIGSRGSWCGLLE